MLRTVDASEPINVITQLESSAKEEPAENYFGTKLFAVTNFPTGLTKCRDCFKYVVNTKLLQYIQYINTVHAPQSM